MVVTFSGLAEIAATGQRRTRPGPEQSLNQSQEQPNLRAGLTAIIPA